MSVQTSLTKHRQQFRPYVLITAAFNVLAMAFFIGSFAIVARDVAHSSLWYRRLLPLALGVGWISAGIAVLAVVALICRRYWDRT